jgi:hypothetical protein
MGGLLAVALFNMSTAFAQLNTSTSRAAVLTFTMPMMSALLAWWWLGERPDRARRWRWRWAWPASLVLAWPVLRAPGPARPAPPLRGLLLPLLAAAGWAVGHGAAQALAGGGRPHDLHRLAAADRRRLRRAGALLVGEPLPSAARARVCWPRCCSTSCWAPRWPTGCGSCWPNASAPRCRR